LAIVDGWGETEEVYKNGSPWMRNFSCAGRLERLELFALERRRLSENLIPTCKILREPERADRINILPS